MPIATRTLRLATRGSRLARWQAEWVAARLMALARPVKIVEITTTGDQQQSAAVADIGAPGIFTKEIQRALLQGEADLAVHSLKDLPTDLVTGIKLVAVPTRESWADVLVARRSIALDELPAGALVGTGSLRRQAQLRYLRPDLQTAPIRGNVDTRVRKLDAGEFDALILAAAGLKRLGLADRIAQVLPLDLMLPAVGQGALGIECRADDAEAISMLSQLDDAASHAAVLAERALLARLAGGCLAPIGALAEMTGQELCLRAVVLDAAGTRRLVSSAAAPVAAAEELGRQVADQLLAQGAAELIAASRS